MKVSPVPAMIVALACLSLPACNRAEGQHQEEHHEIVITSPAVKDVTSTQEYVCQIHSRRHIKVCALEKGYLEEIRVKEGQFVKQGETLFKIFPAVYEARLASAVAEAQLVQIEVNNTRRLFEKNVVSNQELALAEAKLSKALAEVKLARAEFNFTDIKAPFDGIVDRLHEQIGSLIDEGDELTTLSDNSVMWVYFNVPEARYLEYKSGAGHAVKEGAGEKHGAAGIDLDIELVLANGKKFPQPGKIGAIEADFNNETGNIAFRADFPNPDGLLRFGQTGSILIHRVLPKALVIPQRACFEILDKRYVYVVGDDDVVHQREIEIEHEMDDIFVLKSGLKAKERIVLDGVRQITDGEKVEYEFRKPEEVLAHLKHHAE